MTFQLQIADVKAGEKFFSARHKHGSRQIWFLLSLLIGIISPALFFGLAYTRTPQFEAAFAARGIAAFQPVLFVALPIVLFGALWWLAPILGKHLLKKSPPFQQETTLHFDKNGIHGQATTNWLEVKAVEETHSHIFVEFEPNQFFIIPKRAFTSPLEATQFAAKCRDLWANAKLCPTSARMR